MEENVFSIPIALALLMALDISVCFLSHKPAKQLSSYQMTGADFVNN